MHDILTYRRHRFDALFTLRPAKAPGLCHKSRTCVATLAFRSLLLRSHPRITLMALAHHASR